jgi:hypothetical protein
MQSTGHRERTDRQRCWRRLAVRAIIILRSTLEWMLILDGWSANLPLPDYGRVARHSTAIFVSRSPDALRTHRRARLDRDNSRTKCSKSGGSLQLIETLSPERGWTN